MTTTNLCNDLLRAALSHTQILDAVKDSGVLGSLLGGLWAQEEDPARTRARKKTKAVPVEAMGREDGRYGYHCVTNFDTYVNVSFGGITDEGLPVPVTRSMSPYAFSTFVQYDDGSGEGDPRVTCPALVIVHSDAIIRTTSYDKLAGIHFGGRGHYWDHRDAKQIQAFLRELYELPQLTLRRVLCGCNATNGYPYWLFKFTP